MKTLGIDVGSSTAKAVIFGDEGIVAWHLIPTGPDSVETAQTVSDHVLAETKLRLDELDSIISTGYGRIVVPFAHKNISEISCHAKGANYFHPAVRTILDMGGQDCKAISCDDNGKVTNFVMNDKCAAGAGRSMFIVSEILETPLAELGPLSLEPVQGAVPVSSTCVVLARSEILHYLRQGVSKNDILAGACDALCSRVKGQLRRVGVQPDFMVTGGIAKNIGVVRRVEKQIGLTSHSCFEPQIVGALGAAILAREVAQKKANKKRRRREPLTLRQ